MQENFYKHRRVINLAINLSREEPVIALHGARSVGKSTTLQAVANALEVEVLDLDDNETLDAVKSNLAAAVNLFTPVCIDEYQKLPVVLDAIKARLNREGSLPGTAIITGSTRQDALPVTAQALTGRIHSMQIWPLSQGEIDGTHERFVELLLTNPHSLVEQMYTSKLTRADYVERICTGGMPIALERTEGARNRWFDNFVQTSIERDAAELGQVRDRAALTSLVRSIAAQTGQILNISKHAETLEVSRKTVDAYLRLLEDLFIAIRLPAWDKKLSIRSSSHPKIHIVDSGLAARLLRLTPDKLTGIDVTSLTEFGHLLETFVVGEVRKQVSWLDEPITLGHWRTTNNTEVDLILETGAGKIVGIEIKANELANPKDFKGLRQLRDSLGDRFTAGVVFTTGKRAYEVEDRLFAMPVDMLWQDYSAQE